MRTLIWKELRENYRWALLAMVVLGIAEIHALYESDPNTSDYYYYSGMTICKKAFLTITTFGCAGTGFLLGLIQILPELKRDRWAALLHRPLSRGTILRGKVAAGLLLYLIATVPPFLLCVWLAATPGHFPVPFVPEMVLPGTADICAGLIYYFAALATALLRGRWLGPRLLIPLAAVHATNFILANNYFYVAVEAAVLMALALFTAAWGIIHHQELLRARPWLGKVAVLAVVFYGVCGLIDLTKPFLTSLLPHPRSTFYYYQLLNDGRMVLVTDVNDVIVSAKDLDGKPLVGDKYKPDRIRNQFNYLNGFSSYIGDPHRWHYVPWISSYRETRTYLWSNGPYMSPRLEQWFYLVRSRTLVGFLPNQKIAFAQLGQDGFAPPTATIQGFSPDTDYSEVRQSIYALTGSNDVRFVYLPKQKIVPIVLPEPGPVFGLGNAFAQDGEQSSHVTGITQTHGLAIYNDKGELQTALPYHQDMDRWGSLSLGINGAMDRYYLWYEPSAWIDDHTKKSMPSYLEVMNPKGEVLQSYTIPHAPEPQRADSWDGYLTQRLQSPAFFFGQMLYREAGILLGSKRMEGDLHWQWNQRRQLTEETCVWILIASSLLGVLTFVWARRVHFSPGRAWAWAAFVFAFHFIGLVTFRLAADWPRQIRCPRCGQKRPTELELCPHCGKDWPSPESNGAEILETTPAERLTPASV